jgi:hypothetical protein
VAPDTRYEQAAAIFKHDKNWTRSLTGRRQRREREKLQVEPPREKLQFRPKGICVRERDPLLLNLRAAISTLKWICLEKGLYMGNGMAVLYKGLLVLLIRVQQTQFVSSTLRSTFYKMAVTEFTFYYYDPSLAAGAIFAALFGLTTFLHLYQLLRTRTWFMIPFAIGGVCMSIFYPYFIQDINFFK